MTRLSRTLAAVFATMMLVAETSAAAPPPKRMPVEDFFLDRKSLIGQEVEVDAQFKAFGDLLLIVLAKGANGTFVDVDAVPREDRRALYARCQALCDATVRGVVKVIPSALGPDVGIVASSFTLKP